VSRYDNACAANIELEGSGRAAPRGGGGLECLLALSVFGYGEEEDDGTHEVLFSKGGVDT
jgi:hypothetical protein